MHGTIETDSIRPVVLVAEDEFLVAADLAETVEVSGFAVDGPYPTLTSADDAAVAHRPDCALLDVRLADAEVFPLADRLRDANVPIVFHSGHLTAAEIADRYPGARICTKPCPPDHLMNALHEAIEQVQPQAA